LICDWDDHHPGNDAMPWMWRLKEINPAFRATLFTIPGLCSPEWLDAHPDWIELVPHGWLHPSPLECRDWSKARMFRLLDEPIIEHFSRPLGWKSPGWQTSGGVYEALVERGVWVADQHLDDHRRPPALKTNFYEDGPDRWHGHVQDVCGNGISERWEELLGRVVAATDFWFASQALS
jgi:hypothetical protein